MINSHCISGPLYLGLKISSTKQTNWTQHYIVHLLHGYVNVVNDMCQVKCLHFLYLKSDELRSVVHNLLCQEPN